MAATAERSRRRWLTRGVPTSSGWVRIGTAVLLVVGATSVAASALIHLHLWLAGYRHIALIGPAFAAQAALGLVLAAVILADRRPLTVAAGVLYLAGSAAALVLSATVGFLGLHDGLDVPWARASLVVELVGVAACVAVALSMLRPRGPARR